MPRLSRLAERLSVGSVDVDALDSKQRGNYQLHGFKSPSIEACDSRASNRPAERRPAEASIHGVDIDADSKKRFDGLRTSVMRCDEELVGALSSHLRWVRSTIPAIFVGQILGCAHILPLRLSRDRFGQRNDELRDGV